MLAPLGIGILIALALDPLADGLQRKLKLPRGLAVTVLAVGLLALAILLGAVLGPRAVSEASQFSEQLPKTLDEIEELPLIGDWARDNDLAQKVQDWLRQLPSADHRRPHRRGRQQPRERHRRHRHRQRRRRRRPHRR